jgi:alpha-beta hydrolase superfamily lysophospholipase
MAQRHAMGVQKKQRLFSQKKSASWPQIHTLRLDRAALEIWSNPGAGSILFYPGTMLSPLQYRPLLEALRRAGFNVAALHLRGHGINSHRTAFSFDDLLQDGLNAEKWLQQKNYGPVAVCGHSQGGMLATAHAAASPNIVASMPISSMLPQMDEAIELTHFAPLKKYRERIQRLIQKSARLLPRLPLPIQSYLSLGRVMAGAHHCTMNRQHIRLFYPLGFLHSLFAADIGPRLHCPLCLFNARDDALFTPQLTRRVFDRLQAPAKKLVWLPSGGHLAAMNPHLCLFIARHAAAFCAGNAFPLHVNSAM